MTGPRAVFLVAGAVAPGGALEQLLSAESVRLSNLDVRCCQQSMGADGIKYDVAMVASTTQVSRESLGQAARVLAPGAKLYVYEAAQAAQRLEILQKDFVLSGFSDSKLVDDTGHLLVLAHMPNFAIGTKAALTLKRPQPSEAPTAAATAAASARKWALPADDEGEELLDDAELLTEEDIARPSKPPGADDCEVGASGRKACKNCSCGRAEAEQAGAVKLTTEMIENPQSACGSCGLGDAFRCGTCPYRGLPAFETGKKIQLSSDLLTADF